MFDLVKNEISVGDLCWYLKSGTQVRVALVEIVEFKSLGIVCKVIVNNPSGDFCRGGYWSDNYVTKPLSNTNLIRCNPNVEGVK